MPQFDTSSFVSQLFWLSIIFAILYLVISRIVAPMAEGIISSRSCYMDGNLSEAQEFSNKASSLRTKLEKDLAAVHEHIENSRKKASEVLDQEFAIKKQELKVELQHRTDKALSEIEISAQDFHSKEGEAIVSLAAFILEKITAAPVDMELLKTISGKTK